HQFLGTLTVPTTNIKPRSHHRPHRHPQRRRPTPWSSYPVTVNTSGVELYEQVMDFKLWGSSLTD
ncbi:MAG: hypothetical protein KDB71_21125, partial [Mycobacterium sp.]|nr:hypothetical protein [Mycobacterium sp.]